MSSPEEILPSVPPLPPTLPATPDAPIDFETARGCVAHYSSVAANMLDEYFKENYTKTPTANPKERTVPIHLEQLVKVLKKLAYISYHAKDAGDWQMQLQGGRNGSALIGSLHVATDVIGVIEKYDKTMPEGTKEDECGKASKTGLQKLMSGLGISVVGLKQNMTVPIKPSYYLMPTTSIASYNPSVGKGQNSRAALWAVLRNILVAQPGNEALKTQHFTNSEKDRPGDGQQR